MGLVPSRNSPGQSLWYKGTLSLWLVAVERLLLVAVYQRAALPPRCAPRLCPVAEARAAAAKVFPQTLLQARITERVGLRACLASEPPGILQGLRSPTSAALSGSVSVFLSLCLPSPIPVVTCTCFSALLNLSNPQAVNSQGSLPLSSRQLLALAWRDRGVNSSSPPTCCTPNEHQQQSPKRAQGEGSGSHGPGPPLPAVGPLPPDGSS